MRLTWIAGSMLSLQGTKSAWVMSVSRGRWGGGLREDDDDGTLCVASDGEALPHHERSREHQRKVQRLREHLRAGKRRQSWPISVEEGAVWTDMPEAEAPELRQLVAEHLTEPVRSQIWGARVYTAREMGEFRFRSVNVPLVRLNLPPTPSLSLCTPCSRSRAVRRRR